MPQNINDVVVTIEFVSFVPIYVELVGLTFSSERASGVASTAGPHTIFGDILNMQIAYVTSKGVVIVQF